MNEDYLKHISDSLDVYINKPNEYYNYIVDNLNKVLEYQEYIANNLNPIRVPTVLEIRSKKLQKIIDRINAK